MQKNVDIYNELKKFDSLLADVPTTNVFTVPGDYFTMISVDVLHTIHTENNINETNEPGLNMKVPEGYFNELPDVIMQKIRSSASETEGPALPEYIRKQNIFTVPAGYFENLAAEIADTISPKVAKVVTMKSRSAFFNYAVAAGISGIIGLSLFNVFNEKSSVEIMPSTSVIMAQAGQILKNNDFDKVMESVGDDEIVSYLEKNGENVNEALVASVTDEKTLPNEDEYYMDDKALDNFLTDMNIVKSATN